MIDIVLMCIATLMFITIVAAIFWNVYAATRLIEMGDCVKVRKKTANKPRISPFSPVKK